MNKRLMVISMASAAILTSAIACNPRTADFDDRSPNSGSRAPANNAPRADRDGLNLFERSPKHELPVGTRISVRLTDSVDSETASVGQNVSGTVTANVSVGNDVVVPVGSVAKGEVVEVQSAKRFGGQSMIAVNFTEVETPSGDDIPVSGRITDTGKKQVGKDTATIAGSAAGGAILGEILDGKPVEGAVVGGGIGTAVASRKGEEAMLTSGQELVVETTSAVSVRASAER